jgi:hypothetical protein
MAFITRKTTEIVAPFTGAWIEIPIRATNRAKGYHPQRVAPFTGAWIEIGQLYELNWKL